MPGDLEADKKHLFLGAKKVLGRKAWEGKVDALIQGLCACMHAKSLQLCLTLFNPMDCSLPGSSVHGMLQARILALVAISSSSQPRD